MSADIIDGKAISAAKRQELKGEVSAFVAETGITPALAVVLVGEDPASEVYVRNKHKGCEEVGMKSVQIMLPATISETELLKTVSNLNKDDEVHGILVQLPLPPHINEKKVLELIEPDKDVDGFHPINVGRLVIGEECHKPCTPTGVMVMLETLGVNVSGKKAVVIGRSNIVGKPISMMLLKENATVTICHSRTVDLAAELKQADIVVAAVGVPKLVTGDMIKDGAVIIDVGMNRTDEGLVGDVDFESCLSKAGAITPVPGGVGPMTIAMLLKATLKAAVFAAGNRTATIA